MNGGATPFLTSRRRLDNDQRILRPLDTDFIIVQEGRIAARYLFFDELP
jgi:hypothetical protein